MQISKGACRRNSGTTLNAQEKENPANKDRKVQRGGAPADAREGFEAAY